MCFIPVRFLCSRVFVLGVFISHHILTWKSQVAKIRFRAINVTFLSFSVLFCPRFVETINTDI